MLVELNLNTQPAESPLAVYRTLCERDDTGSSCAPTCSWDLEILSVNASVSHLSLGNEKLC